MFRKLLIALTLLFVLPMFLCAQTKNYKIACNENYHPYITKNIDTGELEGVVIDVWRLWAEKTGAKIEFIPMDMENCIKKTNSGEVDAIAGLFFSEERSKYLDFTEPILRMKTVLFLKKGNKPDSLQAINDSIGVIKNDLAYFYIQENFPEIKLKVFGEISELQLAVQNRIIDGFVYDIPDPVGNYRKMKLPKGYYIYETLFFEKLRAAVKPGNSEMMNAILSGVSKMTDDDLNKITEKWDVYKPNRNSLWIILIIGLAVGIMVALLISLIFRSKRKIKEMEDHISKTDWKLIIDKGENDQIEFKSSLRWDYRLEKANKVLEKVIAKTISAFLNTEGGMLFIGVDDEGNILGLENDINSLSKKNRDGFLLTLTNIINVQLGKSVHQFVTINIISINEKDVCIVNVDACDKPVFMGKNDNEEFYIRASASSQPLGVRETYKYINSRWK